MTDNEIISIDEAIKHCYETYYERDDMCKECREEHRQLAKWLEELKANRDLINRQKTEIERYKSALIANAEVVKALTKEFKTAKSKGRKEFAERLKEYELCMFCSFPDNKSLGSEQYIVTSDSIDNLLEEMDKE